MPVKGGMERNPSWTDLALADGAERLLEWAHATVPFARRHLDHAAAEAWRGWGADGWRRAAVERGLLSAGAEAAMGGGAAEAAWAAPLRDTLDPEVARRLLTSGLPGLKRAGATDLLRLVGHPAVDPATGLGRVLGRMQGRSSGGAERAGAADWALIERWARAGGLSPGQLRMLLTWLAGGRTRGGVGASGRAVCGPVPRCMRCPLAGHCVAGLEAGAALDQEAREDAPRAATGESGQPARANDRVSPRITDLPPADRPRERLLRGEPLDLAELLAIIIRTGTPKHSAIDLARELLLRHPTLRDLADAGTAELSAIAGLGMAKAAALKAAVELGRRAALQSEARAEALANPLNSARAIFEQFARRFDLAQAEQCLVLMLNAKCALIREEVVAMGSLDSVLVHPREVFAAAVRQRAHRIVVVHNHPSGDPTPSNADRQLTARLASAGDTIGIPLLDHIIFGARRYFSFAEEGLLPGRWR